ncbi:MAG TPA: restriction endonuclease subunit S [Sphingobacteriaceae bacterium]|nr:restriction endonuclease subunit S [Sphingobacteriaceae bacterium]
MKKVRLRELCLPEHIGKYGIPASAEKFSEEKVRYLRISDIDDKGNLLNNDKKSVSSDDLDKYILNDGDIVFARTGNSTGRTYFHEDKNGVLAFAGFLIKYGLDYNKVNPKFLKYFTISEEYKQWVKNLSTGSTRGNINAQTFADCPIPLIKRNQQDLLVKVLSALDDKIELNNKINAELEAIAKTLYDYWFVQFDFPNAEGKPYKSSGGEMIYDEVLKREIPKGWEVKNLGDLSAFKNGINYNPKEKGDSLARIINVRNISKSTIFIENEYLDELELNQIEINKYLVDDRSIIIARSGTPGATRLIRGYKTNTIYCGFIICLTVTNIENLNLLYFNLKDFEKNITSQSNGTIMQNVNQQVLISFNVILPESKILETFNLQIDNIFQKILNNSQQNQELASLRDWLLPMLMNGQVKVVEAYKEVEEKLGMVAEGEVDYKLTK